MIKISQAYIEEGVRFLQCGNYKSSFLDATKFGRVQK